MLSFCGERQQGEWRHRWHHKPIKTWFCSKYLKRIYFSMLIKLVAYHFNEVNTVLNSHFQISSVVFSFILSVVNIGVYTFL